MRWPIRHQMLVPMGCLVLGALLAVSLLNGILAGNRTRQQIEHQFRTVGETLSEANFPLTDAVLRQVSGLTGAEYVYCDPKGRVLASSSRDLTAPPVDRSELVSDAAAITRRPRVEVGPRDYFHAPLQIRGRGALDPPTILHVLYPEQDYQQAWRQAFNPPLVIGMFALVLVAVLGSAIAARVTRPLQRLRAQVEEIAGGSFRQLPPPQGDDEIADLSRSINHMAGMLSRYEQEVRRNEQLRTLDQLGSGIGHQMRNSVTGCRLALQLHARECPLSSTCESLPVAQRQLDLMERYVRRFLLSGSGRPVEHRPVDLSAVVENVVALVQPAARHVGVDLDWHPPEQPATVRGDPENLEQLVINLVLNAIQAASQVPLSNAHAASPPPAEAKQRGRVEIRIRPDASRVLLDVCDWGPGPSAAVQATLFEPFVSDKPDGTGLGLSIARQIARDHQGDLRWDRRGQATRFTLDLPRIRDEEVHGESVDC